MATTARHEGGAASQSKHKVDATKADPKVTDKAAREWMRDRVANWPDNKPPPSEEMDWYAACNEFRGALSQREFRIVRHSETPVAWRKQGRRKRWGMLKKTVGNSVNPSPQN
jgi:hypothetical protein